VPHPLKAFLGSKVTLHYLEEIVLEWDRIRLLVSFTIFFSSISEMGEPLLHKIFKFPFQRFVIESNSLIVSVLPSSLFFWSYKYSRACCAMNFSKPCSSRRFSFNSLLR
jgi:hypothetical protein